MFNLQTKFELSSFIHSKDMMTGDPICRNGPRDLDHAFLGIVRHHKADISRGRLVYEI